MPSRTASQLTIASARRIRALPGALAPLAVLIMLAPAALPAAHAAGATPDPRDLRVYKWVDKNGVVHYGDSVPAQYSGDARSVLNGEGVVIGHVAGQLTAAQQAAQARTEAAARERAQHDQFLLTTYLSVKDIEQLRDQRLQQIEGQIKASSSYIDTLGEQLASLQSRAMQYKPYSSAPDAARMPDDLAEDLMHAVNEERTQRAQLQAKRDEETQTRAQFDADIARFEQLTANEQR